LSGQTAFYEHLPITGKSIWRDAAVIVTWCCLKHVRAG